MSHVDEITDKCMKCDLYPSQLAAIEFVSTEKLFPQFGKVHSHVDPNVCIVKCLSRYFPIGEMLEFSIITKYDDSQVFHRRQSSSYLHN